LRPGDTVCGERLEHLRWQLVSAACRERVGEHAPEPAAVHASRSVAGVEVRPTRAITSTRPAGLDRGGHQGAHLGLLQQRSLPGRAGRHYLLHAVLDKELNVGPESVQVDPRVGPEGSGQRGVDFESVI
jgi:hypothetical protein